MVTCEIDMADRHPPYGSWAEAAAGLAAAMDTAKVLQKDCTAAVNTGRVIAGCEGSLAERLTSGSYSGREPEVSEEELLAVADRALESRSIEIEEHELIGSVIAFGDTLVREVKEPRPDIVSVGADFTAEAAMEVAVLNGFSRVPVSGTGVDDMIGVVHVKDLMEAQMDSRGEVLVGEMARVPLFVPETKNAG